jgi:hypothetical protein
MHKLTFRSLVFATATIGLMVCSACYVAEVSTPAYVDGYQPQFYEGYVVYYDQLGRPYYYSSGVPYWVPVTSPVYVGLVNHWHVYGPAYGHWYARYGYRSRGYSLYRR